MYGIVPKFDDAMFFASAGVWARQRSNALGDLQAPDAAHLDATTATSTFICGTTGTIWISSPQPSVLALVLFPFDFLLHDDRALHPRMRRALEMHDAFLIEPLFICRPGCQHRRSKFAFFAEYAMRHANVRVLKNH